MLFSSVPFVFVFLPVSLLGFYLLSQRNSQTVQLLWIAACSLVFYAYWRLDYLVILLGSVCVNFVLARAIQNAASRTDRGPMAKRLLVLGIIFNVGLLGVYKYLDFLISIVADVTQYSPAPIGLVLPLAISFFTFQQIAYLVDSSKRLVKPASFLNYLVFVTFFPQLIAGPIVHHKEMMPQFASRLIGRLRWKNLYVGLSIFAIGLFKKLVIADQLAVFVDQGYGDHANMTVLDAWVTTLAYTLQLYFDFSGYTDMAIGAARMFGIRLPQNFRSPYKSLSLQEFWRRWHMTLSRFLRDYIYIPLGGARRSPSRVSVNLFATFMIGGIWHGAGWTFIIWGAIHGTWLIVERHMAGLGVRLPKGVAWAITFFVVHCAWVFFRADSLGQATAILKTMFGFGAQTSARSHVVISENETAVGLILIALALALFGPTTHSLTRNLLPKWKTAFIGLVFGVACAMMLATRSDVFLYFNF